MTTNKTIYKTTKINVRGNRYAVTVAKGEFNYVSVLKETNNPFGTSGRDFKNFDEATRHYKSPEMKTELLKIELKIK